VGIRNASAMLVDFRSMQVVASVGSAAFFDTAIAGQVDGTRAKRSPGSTLKPFVYGLAMDQGLIHPMSMLKDAPKRFAAYTPENFDRGFMGPVFARDALVYSRNVPAIDLLARVGHERFHAFLEDGGVADLRAPDHYGLAMVLGGNELTMHELVRLYAMLANDGFVRPLIMRPDDTAKQGHRLLSAEASYLVLDMLRESRRPDALALEDRRDTPAIAWKTGTSYAYRDAWTVGVFGPYVLAVWVGNFDGASNPALVGRTAAAPLFFEIADALRTQQAMNPLPSRPEPHLNLIQVDVCASTGDLPGRHCPETRPSWFIPGISPIRVSDVHRAIRIDNRTGERACQTDIEETHEAVYEFWSSDVLQLFQKAGVARRQPPPWAAGCSLDVLAASGAPPTITAPTAHLEYQLPLTGTQHERFALQATADADVQWLYWFANDRFIAKAPRDETVFWRPTPGHYQMLVVDDLGRSDTTSLQIASVQ
ncbi:MAG: penicillin-binding transpeptidase domain-containing protein, partial [Pseudomonadota bacterium]